MRNPLLFFILPLFTLPFVMLAALVQHIITCLSDGSWGFLIAGAILPFIGVVHGIGIWLGVWG